MKRFTKTIKYLLAGLLLILFSVQSIAQTITTSDNILVGTSPDILTPLTGTFAAGAPPVSLQFTLTGGTVTSNWSISGCGASCAVVLNDPATGQATLTLPTVPGTIDFDINVNGGAPERHVSITVRYPIDVVLVLDKSGSMGTISESPKTRWDALITAVDAFIDKFEEFKVDGDRFSISYFDSNVKNGLGTEMAPFIGITSTPPSSKTQINTSLMPPNGPAGLTAMGEAMIHAKAKLPVSDKRTKVEILFTDGEQNWPNHNRLVAPGGEKLNDGTPINIGPGTAAGSIKIYAVGIGSAGSVPAILTDIAGSNRGIAWPTLTGEETTFKTNFTNAFTQLLSQFSPQILGHFRGVPNGSSVDSATFVCNKSSNKLLFEVYSSGRMPATFEKDGRAVNPSSIRSGPGYEIYIFNFPMADPSMTLQGLWKVKVMTRNSDFSALSANNPTKNSGNYDIIAITDDHWLDYTCSTGSAKFKSGDTFKPSVKLSHGGTAITDARVHVTIFKPGQTLGNLLATTNITLNGSAGPDTTSAGIRKYEQLLNDPDFLNKMLPTNQSFDLTHSGNGLYTGSGGILDTSGVYKIIFSINDTLAGGDIIKRTEEQAIYVQFPDVDLAASNAVLTGSGTQWILTIKPMTTQHLFVGPAFQQVFGLTGTGIILKDVVDVGDGSYQLKFDGNPDADINLTLLDVPVYKGKLSNIGSSGNSGLWQKVKDWLNSLGLPAWSIWILLIILLLLLWLIFRRRTN